MLFIIIFSREHQVNNNKDIDFPYLIFFKFLIGKISKLNDILQYRVTYIFN